MTNADDPLAALLKPERLIDVVDVGANPHGGYSPPYKTLLAKRLCRVIGLNRRPEPSGISTRQKDRTKPICPMPLATEKRTHCTFALRTA